LLDRTGVFIAEIRYFSVNGDGIRELKCKVKVWLSYSTPSPTLLGLGEPTKRGGRRYSPVEAWIPMGMAVKQQASEERRTSTSNKRASPQVAAGEAGCDLYR
jgi:hypothetical protein